MPIPADAFMEGSPNLDCEVAQNDCHLLVADRDEHELYEIYQGSAQGDDIAGLTPTADEVAGGRIDHALRFILPNDRMKADVYVRPATHAGGPQSTNPDAPPYGVRLRLKGDFDDSAYTATQKVVLAALKKHGMLLSDGGEIALVFADDRTSTAKWADLGIDSQTFNSISPDAFEVVDLGEEVAVTYDCVRSP